MIEEEKFQIKSIHRYADRYLRSWFPNLPSYQAFNARINRLSVVFPFLLKSLLMDQVCDEIDQRISLIDSMPIMTCSGRRKGKVASEWTDKGYCSTKKQHYYGLKLHAMAFDVPSKLPFPEWIWLSPASEHDLTAVEDKLADIHDRAIYADKAYVKAHWSRELKDQQNISIFTPVKLKKGQTQWERTFNKAADKVYSRAVSAVRQPIEALFAWLIEITDIQRASKVRSTKGLMAHVFGRLAAAWARKVPKINP